MVNPVELESGDVLGGGSHPGDAGVAAAVERAKHYRDDAANDSKDMALAQTVLRDALPPGDYVLGVGMLRKHVESLPPAEQEKILTAFLPDGRRALNDPDFLLKLAGEAMGPLPQKPEEIAAEIAACRQRMRTDRKAWGDDAKAQLRFRYLLRAGGLAEG